MIKVFDRHVNLAKFNESTALYKMVREWIRNKPITDDLDDDFDDQETNEPIHEIVCSHLVLANRCFV